VDAREQRGIVIAATKRIKEQNGKWIVPSQENESRKYTVCADGEHCSCTCPDFEERGQPCKHVFAVRIVIQRELFDDGSEVETRQITVTETRKTYPQQWAAYNAAQTSEKSALQVLLYDLCQSIPESTETRMGRPRLSARDGIFCACMKVYSMLSSRRFHSDLCEACDRGYIARVPHFTSVQRVFDSPATADILTSLISQSAAPLASVESNFAVDSTGFSGCRFDCWFETKWNNTPQKSARSWVKAHAMIGCKTNIVSAVKILDAYSGDHDQLQPLMQETAKQFQIGNVCADKAYLSETNLQAITDIGAAAFIPFKTNSKATRAGVWNTAFHYFNLNREAFLERYHQRSNVESTFSAIKRKFGDSVKAKNNQSMKSEVLCKFLAHNLSCLIHAMEEMGTDVNFGCSKSQPRVLNVIRA
jgi:transposase